MPPQFSSSTYAQSICELLSNYDWTVVDKLAELLHKCWKENKAVFLCGNGGSAANATHLANDFLYGVNPTGKGLRTISLSDNSSIITCLGNDTGYENIFATQLQTQASSGDLLIVFSGSGNSKNVIKAIQTAKEIGLTTAAITGFDGGICHQIVDQSIHFSINNMQIAEDVQQIVGHMLTCYLRDNTPNTEQ